MSKKKMGFFAFQESSFSSYDLVNEFVVCILVLPLLFISVIISPLIPHEIRTKITNVYA